MRVISAIVHCASLYHFISVYFFRYPETRPDWISFRFGLGKCGCHQNSPQRYRSGAPTSAKKQGHYFINLIAGYLYLYLILYPISYINYYYSISGHRTFGWLSQGRGQAFGCWFEHSQRINAKTSLSRYFLIASLVLVYINSCRIIQTIVANLFW